MRHTKECFTGIGRVKQTYASKKTRTKGVIPMVQANESTGFIGESCLIRGSGFGSRFGAAGIMIETR